jgi:hypothetical protein
VEVPSEEVVIPFEEVALASEVAPQSAMEVLLGRDQEIEWEREVLELQKVSEGAATATETAKWRRMEMAEPRMTVAEEKVSEAVE